MFCKTFYRLMTLLTSSAVLFFVAGCNSVDTSAPTRIDDFDYTSVVNNHLTLMDFGGFQITDSSVELIHTPMSQYISY